MYTIPSDMPIKTILLANGLSSWGVSGGRTEFVRNKCPVDRCILTADSREAGTADAILFKDHHTPFNVKRPPTQVKLIWSLALILANANLSLSYQFSCPYTT